MRLKSFNEEKNNKKIILIISSVFFVVALILVLSSYSLYQKVDDTIFVNGTVSSFGGGDIILSVLVDGESVNEMPSKSDYFNVTIDCGVTASGRWDYDEWAAVISNINATQVRCNVSFIIKEQFEFTYNGASQEFIVPKSGRYQMELWGAQGGSVNDTYNGGYGAYSVGEMYLEKGDILYVTVGSQGGVNLVYKSGYALAGFNGGGAGGGAWGGYSTDTEYKGSGGGATSIAKISGTIEEITEENLEQIIIIAAGGGGSHIWKRSSSHYSYCHGGHAGGVMGNLANCTRGPDLTANFTINTPATQSEGGCADHNGNSKICGSFGLGVTAYTGGGGGLYGGAGYYASGAGGGSSYINNPYLTNKAMYCYDCTPSDDEGTKTISVTNVLEEPTSMFAKKGNGYAKITYLGS